jgi:hypothetical protein
MNFAETNKLHRKSEIWGTLWSVAGKDPSTNRLSRPLLAVGKSGPRDDNFVYATYLHLRRKHLLACNKIVIPTGAKRSGGICCGFMQSSECSNSKQRHIPWLLRTAERDAEIGCRDSSRPWRDWSGFVVVNPRTAVLGSVVPAGLSTEFSHTIFSQPLRDSVPSSHTRSLVVPAGLSTEFSHTIFSQPLEWTKLQECCREAKPEREFWDFSIRLHSEASSSCPGRAA